MDFIEESIRQEDTRMRMAEEQIMDEEDRVADAYEDWESMEENDELDAWAAGVMRGYARN